MKTLLDFRKPISKKPNSTLEHEKDHITAKGRSKVKEAELSVNSKTPKSEGRLGTTTPKELISNSAPHETLPKSNCSDPHNEIIGELPRLNGTAGASPEHDEDPWCNSPDTKDYLECIKAYPCHPADEEYPDPMENKDLLIEKILSGGFSNPRNPPSPLEFYRFNSLYHETLKTIDPCDFIWDTPENYALAHLYSMSARIECGIMYLEQAAFYMGCLIACGLIDRKLVERELFESAFGLTVEELFDIEDIRDMEEEIRETYERVNRNWLRGSLAWQSGQYRSRFRILKPRQPNYHINAVLRI